MKARTLIGLALLFAVGLVFGFQSAQDVFQQALSKERSEGNLKEAIVLYQKAIDLSKDEALSAKAQLQIGLCYEKLGLQEAEKAFKLVIEKYPGQAEAVRMAKERLANISMPAAAGTPVPASGLTLRKLDIPSGIPSPDGKYITSELGGLDLYLYDIAARKNEILRKHGENLDFLMSSGLWAPNSRRFAYVWSVKEIDSLNVWDIAEHSSKKILENPDIDIIGLAGWTPDQEAIFVVYNQKDRIRRIGRISLSNGLLTEVLADNNIELDPALSPDGRFIVLNYSDRSANRQDIRTLLPDGKLYSVLLPCLNSERFLVWSSDGKHILFTSKRTGENAIWSLEVRDGRAVGEPSFVNTVNGNIYECGMTLAGSFFYSTYVTLEDAFTAKIDFQAGKTIQTPQKIESASDGRTTTPFFSTDGKRLAYFFKKNVAGNPNQYDTLKIKDLETGLTKEIALDFAAQPTMMQLPRWSRDANHIHLLGAKAGKRGLFRLDVATGQSEILSNDSGINAWSSDGKAIFIINRGTPPPKLSDQQSKLIRKNLESGESKILYQGDVGEMMGWVRLSPDESLINFNSSQYGVDESRSLKIIPADAASPLGKDSSVSWPSSLGTMFNWNHDGKGLIGIKVTSQNPRDFEIVYYPKLDPKMTPVDLEFKMRSTNIAVHPDGRTIAFTDTSGDQQFWVMENFLPKK